MLLAILIVSACMIQYLTAYFSSWRVFWLTTILLMAGALVFSPSLVWLSMILYFTVYDLCWSIGCWTGIEFFTTREMFGDKINGFKLFWSILKARCLAPFVALKRMVLELYHLPRDCMAAFRRRCARPLAMINGQSVPVTILTT